MSFISLWLRTGFGRSRLAHKCMLCYAIMFVIENGQPLITQLLYLAHPVLSTSSPLYNIRSSYLLVVEASMRERATSSRSPTPGVRYEGRISDAGP